MSKAASSTASTCGAVGPPGPPEPQAGRRRAGERSRGRAPAGGGARGPRTRRRRTPAPRPGPSAPVTTSSTPAPAEEPRRSGAPRRRRAAPRRGPARSARPAGRRDGARRGSGRVRTRSSSASVTAALRWSFTRSPRIGLGTTASGRAVGTVTGGDVAGGHRPAVPRPRHGRRAPRAPGAPRAVDAGHRGSRVWATRSSRSSRRAGAARRGRGGPPAGLVDALERFCAAGGGAIDADTRVGPASFEAALLAAGAGPRARRAPRRRARATVGFCAVRPPGHHATADPGHGLLPVQQRGGRPRPPWPTGASGSRSSTTTPTTATAPRTSSTSDPRVLYVSLHEWPLYPGTGALDEIGAGAGRARRSTSPSRRAPRATCTGGPSTSCVVPASSASAHVAAGLGRVRRAIGPTRSPGSALSAGDFADLTAAPGRGRPAGPPPPLPRGRLRPRRPRRLGRRVARPRRSVSICGPSRRRGR